MMISFHWAVTEFCSRAVFPLTCESSVARMIVCASLKNSSYIMRLTYSVCLAMSRILHIDNHKSAERYLCTQRRSVSLDYM